VNVWDVSNVASIMMRFITSIPPDKLKKQKLQFIDNIIRGPLFLIPEGRSAVLSPIVNFIQMQLLPKSISTHFSETCVVWAEHNSINSAFSGPRLTENYRRIEHYMLRVGVTINNYPIEIPVTVEALVCPNKSQRNKIKAYLHY
jgi:hypothetical protein